MSRHLTFFCTLVCLYPCLLSAQDSSFRQLDEVVVTANKFPQKQNTTGKVIAVIDQETIAGSAGKTLPQLLNEQAGVVVGGALNNLGSVQSVYVRGAASGRTLILLDGIPVNDPSMIGNEFDLNLFALQNIERIEICKGAQSTLYGSDAVAGVINLITRKSNVDKPLKASATLSAGNYNTWKGNAQLWGKKGKLSYAARYATLYSDGFSSAADTGNQHFDKDGYRNNVWSGNIGWQATKQLTLTTFVQHSRYKTEVDAGAFTDDKDFTIRNSSLLTGAGFSYQHNALTLRGNYQYNELNRYYLNDSFDVPTYVVFDRTDYYSKTHFAELYASETLGNGFTLLQGGDYRMGSMHSLGYSTSFFAPDYYAFTTSFPDTSVSQASLYASLLYKSKQDRFHAELGGRLNVHSQYGSNVTYTFNPSLAVTEQVRLFGSVATGYKAPTLYQLYSPYGNADLQPETSVNYEAGVQWQPKTVTARLVYFYRNIRSGLDFDNHAVCLFQQCKTDCKGHRNRTDDCTGNRIDHPAERHLSRCRRNHAGTNFLCQRHHVPLPVAASETYVERNVEL